MTPSRPAPVSPEPDGKDWTWVLDRPCRDCGFDAAAVGRDDLADAVRADAGRWAVVLARADAEVRPAPDVWSPSEYACHVRDVNRVFAARLEQMLTHDDPLFDNWDQDATALADRYDLQPAPRVLAELADAAALAASWYERAAAGGDDSWGRPGRRSNGSVFTVESLGRYHLHDLVHHQWDVDGRRG